MVRKIIHVDMDCFYASVETRDNPAFRGLPLAVGGSRDRRGVIATANYEARRFGVHSAMPTAHALRLCPNLILTPPNFKKYRVVSDQIRDIFYQYTTLVEPLSLDEAYLDVTDCPDFQNSATLIAEEIRRQITETTRLTASAGVAPNKFLAKIASDWNKPNGLTVVRPDQVDAFVDKLPVRKIHGVGRVTAEKLKLKGIEDCSRLRQVPLMDLVADFGKMGARLYELARGHDDRPVCPTRERKSLSVENTYPSDLVDLNACREKLPELFQEFQQRLNSKGLQDKVRSLFLKIKFDDFQSTTVDRAEYRQVDLPPFEILLEEAWRRGQRPVRLIGVGARLQPEAELLREEQLLFPWGVR